MNTDVKIPEGVYVESRASRKLADRLVETAEKTRAELAAEEIARAKAFLTQQSYQNVYGWTAEDWARATLDKARAIARIEFYQHELDEAVREELAIHMRPTY